LIKLKLKPNTLRSVGPTVLSWQFWHNLGQRAVTAPLIQREIAGDKTKEAYYF
jgi:hypothetical protein